MSNIPSLKVLHDNRDALLLAEVAAWLHDMGKCADEHIINQASDKPQGYSYSYKTAQSHRLPSGLPDVCLMNETISVKDLIEQGMPRVISDASKPWLLRTLGRCHSAAHVEKELSNTETSTKQPQNNTRLSTAFGLEGNPVTGLTNTLSSLSFNSMQSRATFVPQVERAFDAALGDTRRPINEVTLADWSGAVAALYKSALAGALLGIKPTNPDHLRWRLLRINFDVPGLYAKAIKIGDLLGYKRAVERACEAVKKLIEEEYPFGNEIYRDSTGIYFTFPDLDLPADLAQEIRRRVEEVEMELAPRIAVTVGDGNTATEQLKGILGKARKEAREALAQPFDSQNLSDCWQQQWATVEQGKWEVCPVCRLRPKREKREVCGTCEQRRGSRIETWEQNPAQTIWIDEIADHNDRVALLVGKFDLEDWLSGDLVQTMLVKAVPNKPDDCTPKNPSPARLRRVWETCQRFWTETVEQEILAKHKYSQGDALRYVRYLIIPDQKTGWRENVPYDGTVDGKAISLLWRAEAQHFVTISNLQLSGEIKPGQVIRLDDPDNPRRQFNFTVQQVEEASDAMGAYAPYLPLLASPDQFLALVPATDALEIAEKIRAAYVEQFGKVQNRLPLFLGLVFFQRKTPLLAVMDTARRMLASEFANGEWRIMNGPRNDEKKVTLSLEQNGQCITLQVPLVMGDGTTEDVWYPYFELVGQPAAHHTYRFERDGAWWVHVKTLQAGETVRVTPSRFSYLFLESTAQRFRFDPEKDVLLLDELPRLMKMWDALKQSGITDTGLRNVQALLESKSAAWKNPGDELAHLAETTLKRANLLNAVTVDDVLNGRFARCLELYLHILKLRLKEA
jgi:hypothetical protein